MKPPENPNFCQREGGTVFVIRLSDEIHESARLIIGAAREKRGIGDGRAWYEVVRSIESRATFIVSAVTGQLVSEIRRPPVPGRKPGRPPGGGAQRCDSVIYRLCYAVVFEIRSAGVPVLKGTGPGYQLCKQIVSAIFPTRHEELAQSLRRAIATK